jgi:flavin reductase (DIM6/NTAB) family NADH-FMN oxidoreductase RutF
MIRKFPGKAERYFTTGVSMITSRGPDGPNVMAAEWVMQISYSPVLIAVFIHKGSQTLKNIEKSKEFGVNVASKMQTSQVSVAGGYSGSEINKLQIKDLFKTKKSKKIKALLIAGCTINAECTLVKKEKIGDHVMLVGKVVHIRYDDSQSPLIYHKGRYFGIGPTIEPQRGEILVSKDVLEFFKTFAGKRFVLKCSGVVVKSKDKILVVKQPGTDIQTIPLCVSPSGVNQKDHLVKFLRDSRLTIQLDTKPIMKRFVLRHKKDLQRINLVLYSGKIKHTNENLWISKNADPILKAF